MFAADEVITTNEPIEPDVPTDQIRNEPYTLPDSFAWDTLDLDDVSVVSNKIKVHESLTKSKKSVRSRRKRG